MKRAFEAVYYLVVAALAYWITVTEGPQMASELFQQTFAVALAAVTVACCIVIERVFADKEQEEQ